MTADDVKVGRYYEARRPRVIHTYWGRFKNDRQIRWISSDREYVQYDGPAVPVGGHYPKVLMVVFLKWAGIDITEIMPENLEWRKVE
jgi:hypothetical protein